jgi:hypothetical protein
MLSTFVPQQRSEEPRNCWNANRLTPTSSPHPHSRRREARHPAIDLPTKPESVLPIFIAGPAEAHIEHTDPASIALPAEPQFTPIRCVTFGGGARSIRSIKHQPVR